MTAIFLRELNSYFISPIGYVYLAAVYVLAGYEYAILILGGSADLSNEFAFLYTVTLLLTPILTMRLMSEDKKQKTEQALFSAPVTSGGIVAGKYFSAFVVYLAGVAITYGISCTICKDQLDDHYWKFCRDCAYGAGRNCIVYVHFSTDRESDCCGCRWTGCNAAGDFFKFSGRCDSV